ncbi:helix-turn-helix transcriptional regulator [Vallitalea okinawensis]|uniref:helix-turn-helix transcriptional regulator n=1 Tax=Vallitalea okinawensis TaxID=2078660 RepID=UPI0014788EFB|nr:AraC family transcriptional regulator [Vallitalea okinawensis]
MKAPIIFKENIFYEHLQEDAFLSLSYNNILGGHRMDRQHFHPFYEIYYLQDGSADYLIEGNLFSIKSGDMVLINKYTLHKTLYPHNAKNTRYLINFSDGYFRNAEHSDLEWLLYMFHSPSPIIRLDDGVKRIFDSYFIDMQSYAKQHQPGHHISIQSTVNYLLVKLREYTLGQEYTPHRELTPTEEKIIEVSKYIHTHYELPLKLGALAERFYMSPHYLSHKFKEVTGFTLMAYIQATRIKKAQELLSESQLKIIQISEMCGFGSISQFNRVFNKLSGITPSQYRQMKYKNSIT